MIFNKYFVAFTVTPKLSFTEFRHYFSKYPLDERCLDAFTHFGWAAGDDYGIHFPSHAAPVVASKLTCMIRSVPDDIVDRHANVKFRALEADGERLRKEEREAIKSDISAALAQDIPPERIPADLIYFENGTLWVSAMRPNDLEWGISGIRHLFQLNKIDMRIDGLKTTERFCKAVVAGAVENFICPGAVWVCVGNKKTKLDVINTNGAFLTQQLEHSEIDKLAMSIEEYPGLIFTINATGGIQNIKTTKEFKDAWKCVGDPRDANELYALAIGVWVNTISNFFSATRKAQACYTTGADVTEESRSSVAG